MTKHAFAAALIVGAVSTSAFGKNGPVQYYFGTADGAEYCENVKVFCLFFQKRNTFSCCF
jgi:hypothetical protein